MKQQEKEMKYKWSDPVSPSKPVQAENKPDFPVSNQIPCVIFLHVCNIYVCLFMM